MHQQDISKDDMLEALLAILDKMKDYISKNIKENDNSKEINTDNKIEKFQNVMKYIKEQDISPEINELADNMKNNPERSLELLNGIIKAKIENNLEIAKEKVNNLNIKEPKELAIPKQDIETLKNIKDEFVRKIDELINKYNDITNIKDGLTKENNMKLEIHREELFLSR